MMFKNRKDAGRLLAEKLISFKDKDIVVYALPRGGVAVGAEIAQKLNVPLDLIISKKIGHPENPEYAIGATTDSGDTVKNEEIINFDKTVFRELEEEKIKEAQRRKKLYLDDRKRISCEGKIAIIADDGIATGLTMDAAILQVQKMKPKKIVVAVPVVPVSSAEKLNSKVDLATLFIPEYFEGAVGSYYEDFPQVVDSEVISLMKTLRIRKKARSATSQYHQ